MAREYEPMHPRDLPTRVSINIQRYRPADAKRFYAEIVDYVETAAYFWIPRLVIPVGGDVSTDVREVKHVRRRVRRLVEAAGLDQAQGIVIGIGSITEVATDSPPRFLAHLSGDDRITEVVHTADDREHDAEVLVSRALYVIIDAVARDRTPVSRRASVRGINAHNPRRTGENIIVVNAGRTTTLADHERGALSHTPLTSRHRVRGHWRNQPCGPQRSQRKRIYIQPHWAGPEGAQVRQRVEVVVPTPKAG